MAICIYHVPMVEFKLTKLITFFLLVLFLALHTNPFSSFFHFFSRLCYTNETLVVFVDVDINVPTLYHIDVSAHVL